MIEDVIVSIPAHDVRGLEIGSQYRWRVGATTDSGTEEWSTERSLEVNSEARLPEKAQPTGPGNGVDHLPLDTRVSWLPVEGATRYHLQVSLESRLLLLIVDFEHIESTQFAIRGLVNTYPYWWRVRAVNPAGYGPWSPVWTFVIEPKA
jgi:hypothetical protein